MRVKILSSRERVFYGVQAVSPKFLAIRAMSRMSTLSSGVRYSGPVKSQIGFQRGWLELEPKAFATVATSRMSTLQSGSPSGPVMSPSSQN